MNQDHQKYLKEGPLTHITPLVSETARKIGGKGVDILFNIQQYLDAHLRSEHLLEKNPKQFEKLHQTRDADSILRTGFTISCTDDATAFCALARANDIPTKYIQTVDIFDYLQGGTATRGHTYCECYLEGDTYLIDPVFGIVIRIKKQRDYTTMYRRGSHFTVPIAEGLDNRDCGITSHEDLVKRMTLEASNFLGFFAAETKNGIERKKKQT